MMKIHWVGVAIFFTLGSIFTFLFLMPSSIKRITGNLRPARDKHFPSGPLAWKDAATMTRPTGEVRTMDMKNVSPLLEVGRQKQQQHGAVLFCMINDAYFDFAASWCCNTGSLGVHEKVLLLTTDLQTGRRLKALCPAVSVVALDPPQFSGFHNCGRLGHVRMMTERTRFILRLLEAGIRVLLFEVDCLWLKNPLPLMLAHQTRGDIVGTRVLGDWSVTAAGFLLLNPTATTLKFWQQLTSNLDEGIKSFSKDNNTVFVAEAKNEQESFKRLTRQRYAGIKIFYLSNDLFPDGKWYSWPEKKRRESRPVIINNNWVVGKAGKMKRAKAFGHWFWNEKEGTCNATAIYRLFH